MVLICFAGIGFQLCWCRLSALLMQAFSFASRLICIVSRPSALPKSFQACQRAFRLAGEHFYLGIGHLAMSGCRRQSVIKILSPDTEPGY
jgi:hypothetical protein